MNTFGEISNLRQECIRGANELITAAQRDMQNYPATAIYWLSGAQDFLKVLASLSSNSPMVEHDQPGISAPTT